MEPYSPPRERFTPTQRRKQRLADRDGGWWCAYCGAALVPVGDAGRAVLIPAGGAWTPLPGYHWPTEDHVVPRTRGGGDELANLVLACQPCNTDKGSQTIEQWLVRLEAAAWAEDRRRAVLA
jgi:5-methylcytosine-specific restriction endonuclease McrA